MKEDFVTYQQAVKLKELGFDWACRDCFRVDNISKHPILQHYLNWEKRNSAKIGGSKCAFTHISAPTLTIAAKWLRQVHKINIRASYLPYSNQWFYDLLSLDRSLEVEDCYDIHFSTYEDALSGGISAVIELLIGKLEKYKQKLKQNNKSTSKII